MGFLDNIKKISSNIKANLEKQAEVRAKKRKEDKAFNDILQKKLMVVRRQSYAKEALKQSKISARNRAKVRFGSHSGGVSQNLPGNIFAGGNNFDFGIPSVSGNFNKSEKINPVKVVDLKKDIAEARNKIKLLKAKQTIEKLEGVKLDSGGVKKNSFDEMLWKL